MSSSLEAALPACPPALLDALRAEGAEVVRLTDHAPRYHVRLASAGGPLFAWYSGHPDDREALRHELAVRATIESGNEGVLRCPPVLAHGDDWRLERMIEPEPLAGAPTMALVVEAWRTLTTLDLPRRRSTVRSASTFQRVQRWARLARSPLPVKDVLQARRLTTDLPMVTAHGDFHAAHVLPRDGAVWVIDWELSGKAPRGLDLMQLWASLPDEQQRADLMDAALAAVGPGLLPLRYVALVRRIASKLAEHRRFGDRDPAEAQRLLALLPEARV